MWWNPTIEITLIELFVALLVANVVTDGVRWLYKNWRE